MSDLLQALPLIIHDDELLLSRMCEQYPQAQLPSSNPEVYDNVLQTTSNARRYNDLSLWQKMELRGSMLMRFSRFLRYASPHLWTSDERMRRVQEYIHSHIVRRLILMICRKWLVLPKLI